MRRALLTVYVAFGIAVVVGLAAAEWRGYGPLGADEARGVPRTVRDNPGSYRSTYVGGPHYYRGK